MSQAIPLAELERRLQIRLTSPIPAANQQRNYESNLVHGHEAATAPHWCAIQQQRHTVYHTGATPCPASL